MSNLQDVFNAEANELIASLESALLTFENDLTNISSVSEIFRVMHTLKGSASMFGYETVSGLTHNLETIYDSIRAGTIVATPEILQVTLRSVDHLKTLMQDPVLQDSDNRLAHDTLLASIKSLSLSSRADVNTSGHAEVQLTKSTYYVYCKPHSNLFKTGTNVLYLVDDVTGLGEALVFPHFNAVPKFQDLKADECYTSFEVILVTAKPEQEIKDVFIFVDDSCDIKISKLADNDLLQNSSFVKALQERRSVSSSPFGFENVLSFSKDTQRNVVNEFKAIHAHAKNDSSSIRVSSDKLDELMNLVSELVTSQARLTLIAEQLQNTELTGVAENMEKITRRLRDNAFNICLIPIESLVTRFQRLVRDLSKDLKKEVEFTAEGTETELDRSVIEKVTDPILHILRNCIDHAIELPEERIAKGKQAHGKIHLKAFHSGTSVCIQVTDDGRGIDPVKIRQKAISKGLINEDQNLTDKEILSLIFAAGFSTAEKITDVSGRGVGMDIVKKNIEAIHGEVFLDSKVGEGTTIMIKLPLTLSIIDGMLVQIGGARYILPLTVIDKCYEIGSNHIKHDMAQRHVFDGNLLPVFNLHHVFGEQLKNNAVTQVIKINHQELSAGLTVDQIIGEYQAVMKPLGDFYRDYEEFSGATILGDGCVALVIDTDKLIRKLVALSDVHAA